MADLNHFDPNSIGLKANTVFGLPFTETDASLVLLPVPWEVTVSYRPGTATGPEHILNASFQVDLYDPDAPGAWQKGIYMLPPDADIKAKSDLLRWYAEDLLSEMADGRDIMQDIAMMEKLAEVNDGCKFLVDWVYRQTSALLEKGKKVALIGGDHSTPLGYIKALANRYEKFGILQIDAHADLRIAYEGFTYSHASIMFNVLNEVKQVTKLVQVGIRDYCDEELAIIKESGGRVITYFDRDIKTEQYEGGTWRDITKKIIDSLPEKVYISFDIDGLDPKLCPGTGTPVPGGFEMEQVFYLFRILKQSGREIIGFDVNEVSAGKHVETEGIDGMVGARVLYKLCSFLLV